MQVVEIKCDRCHRTLSGFVTKSGIAGFFDVTKGKHKKFANPKEKKVCDECIYSDSRFTDFIKGVKI